MNEYQRGTASLTQLCRASSNGLRRHACAVLPAMCAQLLASSACADGALETIEVTGSRIPRRDFETASPIVSLSAQPFQTTSAISAEQTLNQLPQFVPAVGSTSVDPGNDGQSNVSLRGLGAQRTLVLLNGRRLPAFGLQASTGGGIDLNAIPVSALERIEILTDGASSIY